MWTHVHHGPLAARQNWAMWQSEHDEVQCHCKAAAHQGQLERAHHTGGETMQHHQRHALESCNEKQLSHRKTEPQMTAEPGWLNCRKSAISAWRSSSAGHEIHLTEPEPSWKWSSQWASGAAAHGKVCHMLSGAWCPSWHRPALQWIFSGSHASFRLSTEAARRLEWRLWESTGGGYRRQARHVCKEFRMSLGQYRAPFPSWPCSTTSRCQCERASQWEGQPMVPPQELLAVLDDNPAKDWGKWWPHQLPRHQNVAQCQLWRDPHSANCLHAWQQREVAKVWGFSTRLAVIRLNGSVQNADNSQCRLNRRTKLLVTIQVPRKVKLALFQPGVRKAWRGGKALTTPPSKHAAQKCHSNSMPNLPNSLPMIGFALYQAPGGIL